MEYECEAARIFANISISEWESLPGTRMWVTNGGRSKCDIVILYRMSNFIPNAAQDAQIREMERKANRKGGK